MQYGGFLLSNYSSLEEKYDSGHAYTQFIGTCEGVKVDIPKGFEDASKYNGTLAHKTQHDFNPNGEMRTVILFLIFQSPRPPIPFSSPIPALHTAYEKLNYCLLAQNGIRMKFLA